MRTAWIFICLVTMGVARAEQASNHDLLRARLQETIRSVDRHLDAVLGVGILDLTTGDTVLHHGDQIFPIASSIKIAVLAELFRQKRVPLDDAYTLRREDIVAGDGVLQRLTPGATRLTIRDLATLTVTSSDNTATNVLIDRLGMDSINKLLDEAGLQHTRLRRKMMDTKAATEGRENTSTPREMLRLLEGIFRGSPELVELLSLPKESSIPRKLPATVRVANKPGSLEGVRTDSGIIFLEGRPFALTVMTTFAADEEKAEAAISEIAAAAFRYFERLARSSELGRRLR